MGQKEGVKKYFDNLSSDYQKAYQCDNNDPVRTHIFNERKKIVLELIGRENGRLLDIGCGPGVMTKELLKKNFLIYNTDISPSMIERARRDLNGHRHKDRVFFKVCDIEHLDFENSYFDVVLCVGVIEYLQDYHDAITIISKILKNGGTAIISLPNRWSLFNIIDSLLASIVFRVNPKAFNSRKSIRQRRIATKRFAPLVFAQELKRYGLSKVTMKFHGYRLAAFRRFFPKFWIFLSRILNRVNLFLLACFLANDCVIKFKKDAEI